MTYTVESIIYLAVSLMLGYLLVRGLQLWWEGRR